MDFDFGGELSEEWISQPQSSTPPSSPGRDTATINASGSMQLRQSSAESSGSAVQRSNGPLTDISPSVLNASGYAGALEKTRDLSSVHSTLSNQTTELNDASNGTVQISKNPKKENKTDQGTPEWRRRLVNGQRRLDEQQDLFSSREIERIFNKPAHSDNKVTPPSSQPIEKKSMLPQPVQSPVHLQGTLSPTSVRARHRAYVQKATVSSPKPISQRSGSPLTDIPAVDIPSQRPRSEHKSTFGDRQRSRSLPRPEQSSSYATAEGTKRPASSCSDSALNTAEDEIDLGQHHRRLGSGQSAGQRCFSHSTAYITTSRGNAENDDSFFTRPLSQLSFEQVPRSLYESEFQAMPESPSLPPQKPPASPLKLFAEDDSFTSRHLHRRVSQLEEKRAANKATDDQEEDDKVSKRTKHDELPPEPSSPRRTNRRVSNFGAGELDEHAFEPQSSVLDIPTLDLKPTKLRTLQRRRISSDHDGRVISQSINRSSLLRHTEQNTGMVDTAMHANKKRILVAARRLSVAQPRLPSLYDSTHEADAADGSQVSLKVHGHAVAGRKRKDARYYNEPGATSEEIALRAMLRAKGHAQRQVSQLAAAIMLQSVSRDSLDDDGGRKKSLTTADFFNEANVIMQKIRAQDYPPSSLAGENLNLSELSESGSAFHEEFTIEQLSRPASREGLEPRRRITPRVMDARIVSHLRKFEDKDDLELEWSSSSRAGSEADMKDGNPEDTEAHNIRIRGRRASIYNAKGDTRRDKENDSSFNGSGTTSSSQSSKANSFPSGSSRESGNKATISPEKVSHLLNQTMGGMTFDPKKLVWVKQKILKSAKGDLDPFVSEMTEDDPFQEIPDLTVNESQEIRTIKELAVQSRLATSTGDTGIFSGKIGEEEDAHAHTSFDPSSTISESHRFASSGPIIETRATSWGDLPSNLPETKCDVNFRIVETQKPNDVLFESDAQDIRRNHIRRALSTCPEEQSHEDENETLSESQQIEGEQQSSLFERRLSEQLESEGVSEASIIEPTEMADCHSGAQDEPSDLAGPQRLASESLRLKPDNNMHLALSTPRAKMISTTPSQLPGSVLHYSILRLSPLPDFTVNQPDESLSLDMNYAIRKRGLNSLPEVEKNFSIAIQDLVGKITDIEPHEPFWEYMQQLRLNGQNLWTLHMLADFCSRIEELDISYNELGQLNGAPRSLQVLSASHNHLSGLTAWSHLPNLQYVDVSHNNISTLKSFSGLIHLRELNLEGNEIENLEGIQDLGSLQSLRLSNNKIKNLDLSGTKMRRLKSLDVRNNRIESVVGLDGLTSLRDLKLGSNNIANFSCEAAALPRSLRRLNLANNRLTTLDLTLAPSLDSLWIDGNGISTIKGLSNMRSIRKVSWRRQNLIRSQGQKELDLKCCRHAHMLDLSENKMPILAPQIPFLNLRRLDLISCGIAALGEDFGLQMPNLRVLNLNDNGISDIRPLIGIEMLEELYIARNRLNKLRITAKVIREFAATLRYLDCRDNPATLGFYPTASIDSASKSATSPGNGLSLVLTDGEEAREGRPAPDSIDQDEDSEYVSRLDEETLLRRRVYEALLLFKFKALVFWDGLDMGYRCKVDRETMWARLLELGVLTKLPLG